MSKRNKKYNGIRTITPKTKKSENTNGFSPSEMDVFEVIDHFKTNTENGLTTQSIQKRRKKDGLNLLYSEFKRTFSSAFVDHIKAVVSVLLASSLFLFYAFYKDYFYLISAIIITVSILFDCVLEHIASLKFEKVRKHASLKAVVKRKGRVYVTDSRYLVPGDLVFLQARLSFAHCFLCLKVRQYKNLFLKLDFDFEQDTHFHSRTVLKDYIKARRSFPQLQEFPRQTEHPCAFPFPQFLGYIIE